MKTSKNPKHARFFERCATLLCAMILSLALAPTAHAELYTFTDDNGVIHFTNIPPANVKKEQSAKAENTFRWRDELGAWRRIHRVDVKEYDSLIREAAAYYSLPAALVKAVVAVESSFEPSAVSHAGAQGLMQLIPPTAAEMNVRDPFDPRDNIFGGTRYLRVLANQFNGNLRFTIAAYNAGPNAVLRRGDVPPFSETRRYVERVLILYHHYLVHWQKQG